MASASAQRIGRVVSAHPRGSPFRLFAAAAAELAGLAESVGAAGSARLAWVPAGAVVSDVTLPILASLRV